MRNKVITKGPVLYHSTYIRYQRSQIHRDRKNGGYQGLRGGRDGGLVLNRKRDLVLQDEKHSGGEWWGGLYTS